MVTTNAPATPWSPVSQRKAIREGDLMAEPVRLEIEVDEEHKATAESVLESMGFSWAEDGEGSAEGVVPQEHFGSLDDLFEAEKHDEEGEWVEWPSMPGFSTHVAGSLNIAVKSSAIENEYRAKKKLAPGVELSLPVKIDLMARALVRGGGVKGWRGLKTRDGEEVQFNEDNFVKMYRSKRYRDWVSDWVNHFAGIKRRTREEIRGN